MVMVMVMVLLPLLLLMMMLLMLMLMLLMMMMMRRRSNFDTRLTIYPLTHYHPPSRLYLVIIILSESSCSFHLGLS